MNKSINNKYFFLIGFVIILLLSSCHSKYVSISIDYSERFSWKSDSSAFAFVAINKIYRMPEGIAKFPDGGKTKTEYYDVALYYYNIKNEKLNRAVDFKDILKLYPKNREYLNINLAYTDSLIYYKLSDADNFSIREAKRFVHSENDSIKLYKAIKYVSKVHSYNVNTKKISEIDSLPLNMQWTEFKNYNYLKDLRNSCLQKITYSDWEIILKDIYPQSKKTYMEYIILGSYNKNILDVIYEQIVPEFDQKDKEYILGKMNKRKHELFKIYKNNNDGPYQESLKHDEYEDYTNYIKETKNRFKNAH